MKNITTPTIRPGGAPECSHGWRIASRCGTRGDVRLAVRPEGADESVGVNTPAPPGRGTLGSVTTGSASLARRSTRGYTRPPRWGEERQAVSHPTLHTYNRRSGQPSGLDPVS